ncbi:DUF2267 domain-containing protein [Methyloligella solikamskensis]|uniref:DUF2267 domain-containing protein n=1 Tax=Methyloligella solikamskensis TaxID=1177756 RepID=A0ABW3JCU3_9HYPH
MSATGLEVFDKTLQTTNSWLNEIGETVGPDKQNSYHALRAVLFALRDRLPPEESAHLASQLPTLVRGIYYDGYEPAGKPEKIRSESEFLEKVSEHLKSSDPIDPDRATRAVFKLLDTHISDGEMGDVKQSLPEELKGYFH